MISRGGNHITLPLVLEFPWREGDLNLQKGGAIGAAVDDFEIRD